MIRNYFHVGKANLKRYFLPHGLIGIVFCLLTPVLFGISNLDSRRTAQLLEMYVALIGIILLVPVFLPEQFKDISDVVYTKRISMLMVHFIRIVIGIVAIGIILLGVLIILKQNYNTFPFASFYFGTLASAIFLGGLGMVLYSITDLIPMGYMIPLLYYITNYGAGKKYLGKFLLFTMISGSYEEKYYLAVAGVIFLVVGVLYRHVKQH